MVKIRGIDDRFVISDGISEVIVGYSIVLKCLKILNIQNPKTMLAEIIHGKVEEIDNECDISEINIQGGI